MNTTFIFNASDIETIQPTVINPQTAIRARQERQERIASDIPAEIRYIVPFASWMDRHPVITNIIIVIMALALAYAVFTYEFTIPAYQ
jgi:hypothetical protein